MRAGRHNPNLGSPQTNASFHLPDPMSPSGGNPELWGSNESSCPSALQRPPCPREVEAVLLLWVDNEAGLRGEGAVTCRVT